MQTPLFLMEGGIAGQTARDVDWAKTPLGPVSGWPRSLQTVVGTVLRSRHPMFLWWGPDLIQFYNDGYLPSFGQGKHPKAMGQRGRECWPEIWHIIAPQIEAVMTRGISTWNEDQLVPIFRNGRIEDVYWTYGYSPVFDDNGRIGGTLVVCTETTRLRLQGERLWRLQALAEVTATTTEAANVLPAALKVLNGSANDIPFALACRNELDGPRILDQFGIIPSALGSVGGDLRGVLEARLRETISYADSVIELSMSQEMGDVPWPEPLSEAYVAYVDARTFIVFGLNPRIPFDAATREHLRQIADHLGAAQQRIAAARRSLDVESERRNLLLQAPVATALLTGPKHVFELANRLYCEMTGRFDIIGKSYVEAFPELASSALPGILDSVYETGEPFVTQEMLVPLDRGLGLLDCYFMFNLEPIRDAGGNIYGMMAVAVEVTGQVAARRRLETAQVERERLLRELESASSAKDQFLAMLGHELRNPLAPIVTALQLLRLRDAGSKSELDVIERQVRHMVRLVDDLLDISRITRGKAELRKEALEIEAPISKALEIASVLLEERRHRLSVNVPALGLRVDGDPVRLAQVVTNLLTNAARYTEPGGAISVSAVREGAEVVVRVRDNGTGIAPELLPRIFDAFVQGERGTARSEGGLGLGLSVVRNLVTLHGGTVKVHSEGIGRGSEFEVRLPLTEAAVAAPVRPAAARGAQGKRILLVDDNEDAASSLGEFLSLSGNTVVVVNDPIAALGAVAALRPEIAILDLGLPVMDGYELAERLRKDPASAHCKLIALSGYGQDADKARSRRAGFVLHLVKPVELDDLLRAIAD
ncbi:MAG TPA: ATP-binding protein [Myxococcales bacterium]|nr:ATP-binding protein [Myxococcales bacterium]